MKFGLFTLFDYYRELQNEVDYYRETISIFKEAEALGYDSAWVGEEHFYSFGICACPQLFLAALARETTTMRLGSAISVLPLEHPLRKAEQFAMLDVLSNGRMSFGVGPGGVPTHLLGFNHDMNPVTNRERYEESLEIIEMSWRNTSFSYNGKYWQIPELSVSPRPVQAPCPPIYRGSLSVSGMKTAGMKGHSLQIPLWMVPDDIVLEGLAAYRQALKDHGHMTADGKTSIAPPVFMFFMFCDNDRQAALAEARAAVPRYRNLLASHFPLDAGKILPKGDSMRNLYDMLTSIDEHLEERIIIGTPAQCQQRVAELSAKFGIEEMGFYIHAGGRDFNRARKSMKLFAQEVMPKFKQEARQPLAVPA